MSRRLLVIIPDVISDLVRKGEITPRYYNPGNLFEEVHVLMTNNDHPDMDHLKIMTGRARVFVHHLPIPGFRQSWGWHLPKIIDWAQQGVQISRNIQPHLIRCYAPLHNGVIGAEIRKQLGVPLIISLHLNHDLDERRLTPWRQFPKRRLYLERRKFLERYVLKHSDATICVYQFLKNYAQRLGAKRIEVIYNSVNPDHIIPKESYALHNPVSVIIVGRQIVEKDPAPLIKSLTWLPEVSLTCIGDGPRHENCKALAIHLGVVSRCHFIKSMHNNQICENLKNHDVFVSINNFGGISKAEIEAALVGMPIITNRHPLEVDPELLGKNALVVNGSPKSYAKALSQLIQSEDLRQTLGSNVRREFFNISPSFTEQQQADLYKEFLQRT